MRHFNSRYLPTALLLLLLSACGGGGGGSAPAPPPPGGGGAGVVDPATVDFAIHYGVNGKMLAPFPSHWERQQVPEPEVVGFMLEPAQGANDLFRENVILARVAAGTDPTGSDFGSVSVVSTRNVTIAGVPGQETVFDATLAGAGQVALRFMETSITVDGFVYALIYSGERATFNRLIEVARYMAANMNVGQELFGSLSSGSDLSKPGKPAAINNGNDFFVVSCRDDDERPFPSDVIARTVRQDRSTTPEVLIQAAVDTGNTGCRFTRPTVSFDGANYLVTYMTSFDGDRRIVGQRISTTGQLVDATPFDISANTRGSAFEPVTTYDGARHLVVWYEDFQDPVTLATDRQIRGAFVDTGGMPTAPFVIAGSLDTLNPSHTSLYRPQVALGNNQAMVVFDPHFESETREPVRSIYAQLIDLSGNTLLPAPLEIRSDTGDNPRFAQVASDGQQYVVAWIEGLLEESTIHAGQSGVFTRVVSQVGMLLNGDASTSGTEIVAIDNGELPKEYLDLTYGNGEYMFTWSVSSFGADFGVYFSRASQDLATVTPAAPVAWTDSNAIGFGVSRPSHPTAARSAAQTLVMWPIEQGVIEGWVLP